jgi:hypothetical protein
LGAGALAVVTSGSQPRAVAATSPITFSHHVPVDQQRPGNEPDVLVAPNGHIFSSEPFGFSTTESFIWASKDKAKSFQLTPGTLAGKPATCAGGGDTDLVADASNNLFFTDLQGLTNLSNSVSKDEGATWTTNCASVPNTPVDRQWYSVSGDLNAGTLQLFEEYDAAAAGTGGGAGSNALVAVYSTDGQTFTPIVNSGLPADCVPAVVNCITGSEGISGNVVRDPVTKDLLIAHSAIDANGNENSIRVARGVVNVTNPLAPTATWTQSPNLAASLCATPATCDYADGNPQIVAGSDFAVIAEDSAHHFYVVFSAAPLADNSNHDQTAPDQIWMATSADGNTWNPPVKVGPQGGDNLFSWVTAGDDGRVDVAWYHTDTTSYTPPSGTACNSGQAAGPCYGAGNLTNAVWNVQMAQSLDASGASPTFDVTTASEHPVKTGEICTMGLSCTTGGDRSMGDFFQITHDDQGAALIVFVDDTSQNVSGGEAAGPAVMVRQTGGASILNGKSIDPAAGPGSAMNSMTDPTGDAFFNGNGTSTPAGDNLDLKGMSIAQTGATTATVTINTKSLSSLVATPAVGGPDAAWIARWVVVTPGQVGNGHIYYAGMESDAGGTPRFFDGDVGCINTTHCKYFTFAGDKTLTDGSYDAASGTITIRVPLADVLPASVGVPTAAAPLRLYSAMAFSATSGTPFASTPIFNLTDATEPVSVDLAGAAAGPGGIGAAGCPTGLGYWSDASDGGIFSYGNAGFYGSTGSLVLNQPMVGMATTAGCKGYWLVASDGGIFSFGDATFFGSTGSTPLNKPIVAMASTPTGRGYWLVASDGGIFSFGDATFFGSTGSTPLNKPIVGMASTPTGRGYWLVASDGGLFSFGDATFFGSTGSMTLNKPIVAMAATPTGRGYWLVASDGGIFSFGDAAVLGSTGSMTLNKPIVGIAATPTRRGYWLVATDGGIFSFGDATFYGSAGNLTLNKPIVGIAPS